MEVPFHRTVLRTPWQRKPRKSSRRMASTSAPLGQILLHPIPSQTQLDGMAARLAQIQSITQSESTEAQSLRTVQRTHSPPAMLSRFFPICLALACRLLSCRELGDTAWMPLRTLLRLPGFRNQQCPFRNYHNCLRCRACPGFLSCLSFPTTELLIRATPDISASKE